MVRSDHFKVDCELLYMKYGLCKHLHVKICHEVCFNHSHTHILTHFILKELHVRISSPFSFILCTQPHLHID